MRWRSTLSSRVLAVGHVVERQVGNFGEAVVEPFGFAFSSASIAQALFDRRDLGHQFLRARFVLRLFRFANFLRESIAAFLPVLCRDRLTALFIELDESLCERG